MKAWRFAAAVLAAGGLLAVSSSALADFTGRVKRTGLWADAEPVAPWKWRAAKRQH
jgi:hypothetical protein